MSLDASQQKFPISLFKVSSALEIRGESGLPQAAGRALSSGQ
ncbi:hypothetical protein [Leptospira noguchii]|nr:hypothetical protein [Leptospira noguchii]EMI63966.1 hypothetical protein LEP1GSC072_1390 [Leptospira noguchii str. Bonito]EMS82431.1 hypothetical protein LEP1GSC073_2688 [Leptospira noguchii str. Cascata]